MRILTRALVPAALALATALPLAAQDSRFSPAMSSGDRLVLSNINGDITVTQGRGRTAEIVVTKVVKRGDGDLVKAIMEERNGVVHVCTVYLNRDRDRRTCRGENNINITNNRGEGFDVRLHYMVRVPAGVKVEAENVNGSVRITDLDAPASAETVNGTIDFEGGMASALETVNGTINASFDRADWEGDLHIETVNGRIELRLPASFSARIRGETVNGSIQSDFPLSIEGKWGPKSFTGTIGGGRSGRTLSLESVNGSISLRRER